MLTDQSPKLDPQQISVIVFYEKEAEKQHVQSLFEEKMDLKKYLVHFISMTSNKKWVASYEISRPPTAVFWFQGMEIGRLNRVSSWKQLQAALQSIETLL